MVRRSSNKTKASAGRSNLRDIADTVGVSLAAVSYVLNGKGRIGNEKRRQIEAMLAEAGYRPRRSRYPVVYIEDEEAFQDFQGFEPFRLKQVGINETLQKQQLSLRIETLRRVGSVSLREQLESISRAKPMGVIIHSGAADQAERLIRHFHRYRIPVVQVGYEAWSRECDSVLIDDEGGGRQAAHFLASQGHRRIGVVRWSVEKDPPSARKFAGFSAGLAERGIELRPEYVVETIAKRNGNLLPGREAVDRLARLPEPPTALFIENSFVSAPLLYPIEQETALPAHIAAIQMIHFEAWHMDWMEQALHGKLLRAPRHTHLVRIDWAEIGRRAAQMLLDRIESPSSVSRLFAVPTQLVLADGPKITSL